MHLPLAHRKAVGGHDIVEEEEEDGLEVLAAAAAPLDGDTAALDVQFCSSELSQQSLAPSQIHDGWMQAVV